MINPYPNPMQPIPQVEQNDALIAKAEKVISVSVRDWNGEIEGDIHAAWDVIGTVALDWQKHTNSLIRKAERKIQGVASKIFPETEAETTLSDGGMVGTATRTIGTVEASKGTETREIDILIPQAGGLPPKACKCAIPIDFSFVNCIGPCGTLAWCDPVTGIIQRCMPWDCGEVPPGWCVIGPGTPIPPTPEPPYVPPYEPPPIEPQPPEKCCPEQVIQVHCPENTNRQRPGPCAKPEECDEEQPPNDIVPFAEEPKPPDGECEVEACYKRDGQVLPDEIVRIPLALNKGNGSEHALWECGWATYLKAFAEDDPVSTYADKKDSVSLTNYAFAESGGNFDDSEMKLTGDAIYNIIHGSV